MGLALRIAALWLAALLIGAGTLPAAEAAGTPSFAPKSTKASAETAPPAEVQALLNLLADPKVQAWLTQQKKTEAAAEPAKPALESPQEVMSSYVEAIRAHLTGIVDVVPGMPAEFAHAGDVFYESSEIAGRRASSA
jgi:hypothetical protein